MIVGLDHILTSWVLETISLSRGKGLLTREVGGGRILIDASLCQTSLVWHTTLDIRVAIHLTY